MKQQPTFFGLAALITLSLLTNSPASRAECTCLWQGAFVDIQADTDLIVAAKVIAESGNSIDLEVQNTLRGPDRLSPVRVWLDKDDLCRAEVGSFPLESEWVMALDYIDAVPPGGFDPNTPNISFGREGDYSLSRCGGYWLKKSGKSVTGNLIKGPRWERDPKMSPVLIDILAGYVRGDLDLDTLEEASRVDPELQELILETRLFLKRDAGL